MKITYFLFIVLIHTGLYPQGRADIIYDGLLEIAQKEKFPGMVLWIKKGNDLPWAGATGFRNIENKIKMTSDIRFHTGSLTKLITAVACLQLIEKSQLALSDKVTDILMPGEIGKIPFINEITVAQLLNHQSGIYSGNNNLKYISSLIGADADRHSEWTNRDFLALTWNGENEPFGKPGEDAFYGDNNYILLGMIIEKITASSLVGYVQTNIFDKLSMKDSYYCTDSAAVSKNSGYPHTSGYLVLSEEIRNILTVHPKFHRVNDTLVNTTEAIEKIDGAAAIISTAADVGNFARALFNNELLSSAGMETLLKFSTGIENDPPESVRQGPIRAFKKSYGIVFAAEGDSTGGINTIMAYHPASNTIVVGFINIFGLWKEKETVLDQILPEILKI